MGVHLMHLEVHLKKGAGCPGAFIITRRSGATVSRTEPNRTGDKKAPAHHVFFRNPTRGVTVTQGYTQGCNTARRPEYKQFLASLKERGMGKSLLNDSGSPGGQLGTHKLRV